MSLKIIIPTLTLGIGGISSFGSYYVSRSKSSQKSKEEIGLKKEKVIVAEHIYQVKNEVKFCTVWNNEGDRGQIPLECQIISQKFTDFKNPKSEDSITQKIWVERTHLQRVLNSINLLPENFEIQENLINKSWEIGQSPMTWSCNLSKDSQSIQKVFVYCVTKENGK